MTSYLNKAVSTSALFLLYGAEMANAQAYQKTEFQTQQLREPIWMIGEYYVVSQDNGDQYLYIIPSVYNRISEDNEFNPTNGSIVQMYAQIEGQPRLAGDNDDDEDEDADPVKWYESWSCNLKYFTDVTDKTKDDIVSNIFYEGTRLMQAQGGTFSSSNNREQVLSSAWKNDPELSLIRESNENAVGEKFMIYQCGMYRQFIDAFSTVQLKIGSEIGWIYGYRVYKTLGDFQVDIQDIGEGTLKLIDTTRELDESNAISYMQTTMGSLLVLASSLLIF